MKNFTSFLFFFAIMALGCFGQNQAPVGGNDTVQIISQVRTCVDVKANDYDPNGDEFFISQVQNYYTMEVYIEDDHICLYGFKEYLTTQTIWYILSDSFSTSDTVWLTIEILANENIPVPIADTFSLLQLANQQIDILENDIDPNNENLFIYWVGGEYNCTYSISDDQKFINVIPGIADTICNFSYWINNVSGLVSHTGTTVYIKILPNTDIPTINPDTVIAIAGIPVEIYPLENDIDYQGDEIEVYNFTTPQLGNIEKLNNTFTFTSGVSIVDSTSFLYTIREKNNPDLYTSWAEVFIDIRRNPNRPYAIADTVSVMAGKTIYIDVLANDYDMNNDSIRIMQISGGGSITSDQKIAYTANYISADQVVLSYRNYQINNSQYYSEWAKVVINVIENPGLPVAVSDTIYARGGIPITFKPLKNDLANEADTLILKYNNIDNPTNHHWGINQLNDDVLTYTSVFQANGTDYFRYRIVDEEGKVMTLGDIIVICESKFYDSLQISNINAGVNGGGFLFSRYAELPGVGLFTNSTPPGWVDNFSSHFEYPKNSRKTTIFNSTLWAGGIDSQDNLHLAAERYKQGSGYSGGIDFQPGPIAGQYDTDYLKRYIRTWKVSRAQIEYHMNNYWKSGYTPAEVILNWPGNGKTSNGEAAMLAPFFDRNADGFYDCMDGDYPLIRGDETIFLMYNDDLVHTESSGSPIGLEVHAMVYGYQNPNDTAIYNSVFVHYDLFNRSDETYHDFYFGIFTDTDLGFGWDDYIGCDVANGSFYTYNGKPRDGDGQYWAYGDNPPAQSVTILAGPFKDNDLLDNPAEDCYESINGLGYDNGIADDERLGMSAFTYFNSSGAPGPYMTDPLYAVDYYNFLRAKWKDGSEMMYGGNGHPSTGAVGPGCKYMFPGDSDPTNWGTNCLQPNGGYNQNGKYWTETETQNAYGDRRGCTSMGPTTFQPGQVQEIELAFCIGQASQGIPGSGLENLFTNLNIIKEQVTNGNIIAPNNELGIKHIPAADKTILIYPNPADGFLTIEIPTLDESAHFTIYNLIGNEVSEGLITNHQRQTLNISNLKPGIYLIRVYNQKSNYLVKFVKK